MELDVLQQLLMLLCLIGVTFGGKQKELEIIVVEKPPDCSITAENGDMVAVHYTGTLKDGTVFDSSKQPGREPFTFQLGQGKVIQGWEQGIQGMCVGEKRKLIIPPHLGYGERGAPPKIPGGATLLFETELLNVQKKSIDDVIIPLIRFLSLPTAAIMVVYYLYQKYRDTPNEKQLKKEEKLRKKKKR